MNKVLTLAIALIATIHCAMAQDYDIRITEYDGTVKKFRVENVVRMTYVERADNNVGWTSLGYCLYGEDLIGGYFRYDTDGDLCCDYYVEIQQSDATPGLYRLVNPYSPKVYPFTESTTYDNENDYYLEINAVDPAGVYVPLQDMGVSLYGYGRLWAYSLAGAYLDMGYSLDYLKELEFTGTLADGVITFPQSTLFIYLPEYDQEYYYYANTHSHFYVDLNTLVPTLDSVPVAERKAARRATGTPFAAAPATDAARVEKK